MIDVQRTLIQVMKHEIFSTDDLENKAARQILSELKTKQKDIREEITAEIQYKLLKKMKAERQDSVNIYTQADRTDLAQKELAELNIINIYMDELELELPKQLSVEEIQKIISSIIATNNNVNIGMIMKEFANKNVDKAVAVKIAKEMLGI